MKQIIACSRKPIVKDAVNDALKQLHGDIKLLILMCESTHLAEASKLIKDTLKEIKLIGVSTTCSLANDNIISSGLTLIGLTGELDVEIGLIKNAEKLPIKSLDTLKDSIKKINPVKGKTILFELCTGKEEKLVSTLRLAIRNQPIDLIGGTALSTDLTPLISYEGSVYKEACVYAIIKNLSGQIKIYKENIYSNTSSTPLLVTKSNEREIIEIEGKPAALAYANALNIDVAKIKEHFLFNPFAKIIGKEEYIVAIKEVLPNNSLLTYKKISPSDQLKLLSLTDYKHQIQANVSKRIASVSKVSGVISINCIYRYLLFNQENYLDTYAKEMCALVPHAGFISAGEQFKIQHINQTMVCIVFESDKES